MALPGSLQLSCELGLCWNQSYNRQPLRVLGRSKLPVLTSAPSFHVPFLKLECRRSPLSCNINKPTQVLSCKSQAFKCHSFLQPDQPSDLPVIKAAATTLARSCNTLQSSPGIIKLLPAVAIIVFAIWGVNPLMCQMRKQLLRRSDSNWKKSTTHYIVTSYLQPLLLWVGAILICRALEPVVLPTETGQIVKERLLNFVRSLSTVLSFAYCLSSVIQQAQNFFVESADTSETRNMGFQFAGKAVYTAVWVAAFSLFMELLGFSTQKWVTAGGLGTVLITLAGREIFTNFLSSVMIHATRPFVVNEWIQTKIEGYEVSGTVEHVGWWSPTIIRGEDREAVHIPNHQFTVNIVRNLSQKTHWRIKTHLAISHWDVSKINNIVADMRKVLAKNPQVEQQRLHRRVFLDNINPESQALLILVSCFVKTSHFEEYLCVKETILLDLLRVIDHHGARLATPVRTLQKIYSDNDLENIPFVDSLGRGPGTVSNRPLAMMESPYKTNADDKTRNHKTVRTKHDTKTDAKVGPTVVSDSNVRETPLNSKSDAKAVTSNSNTNENSKNGESSMVRPSVGKDEPMESDLNATFKGSVGVPPDTSASNSKASEFVLDDLTQKDLKLRKKTDTDNLIPSSSSSNADIAGGHHRPSKQLDERKPAEQPLSCRTVIEENIVLGVALEGSKRTLPIEDGMDASFKDSKEMTACQAEDN